MNFFSYFRKEKSETLLILNIGSATVVGALIDVGSAVSKVLATISSDIPMHAEPSLAQFEQGMEKALLNTIQSIAKLRLSTPDKIIVYFAAPWYASQVRVAKMSRPTPFVITKTLLNDMIARELKSFEDDEISGSRGGSEALRAIESNIVQTKLNGYTHGDPVGLSVRELEITIFLSVAPERNIQKIEEIVTKQYHKPVKFASFLLASFLVTRDLFPHQDDYLLVDIGGEVTDLSLVRDGALVQSLSFPRGRNFILRKLSEGLGRTMNESLDICRLYVEDKVEASVKEVCTKILSEAKDLWLDSFQKSLFGISNELSIPDTVLLSVGGDIAPWFIETIRREKFNQYALTEKEFKVIILDAEVFHELLTFSEGVPRNPFIMIEALAGMKH